MREGLCKDDVNFAAALISKFQFAKKKKKKSRISFVSFVENLGGS